MTMRLIGECLDSEAIARMIGMKLGQPHTAGGGNREAGPDRSGEETPRNVIDLRMRRPKRRTRAPNGPAVILRFDPSMRRHRHG